MPIGVLLTAISVRGSRERLQSAEVGGMTLTSEPVSIRKRVLVCMSLTKKRRLEVEPVALVAASVRPIRFPSYRASGTSWQLHQTSSGTSKWSRSSDVSGDPHGLDFVYDGFASDCGCVEGDHVARGRLLAR